MTTATIVIHTQPTTVRGLEWGLAIDVAPGLETDETSAFLDEHTGLDDVTYALVVLRKDWAPFDLDVRPSLSVQIPDLQAAELDAAIAAPED